MNDPMTRYGLRNPAETMAAFHKVGQNTLEYILQISAQPNERKTLRTWGINSAAELVGRSTQSIRRLEEEGKLPYPKQDEVGRRTYSLADINAMRDIFGTRYQKPTKL